MFLQDVMSKCVSNPLPAQANFFRYNVRCTTCDGLESFKQTGAELELWQRAGMEGGAHPLQSYVLRATNPFQNDRGKCIIDPSRMAGYQVGAPAFRLSGLTLQSCDNT